MGAEPEQGSPVRPAATVVVLRDGSQGPEALLTRRPATMAFGPGLHVFPGGALDPADHDPRLLDRLLGAESLPPLHAGPFAVAAIRELFEEAGVLLATRPDGTAPDGRALDGARTSAGRFAGAVVGDDLRLRADWLVPLSRWVTPPVYPRRFDARFFVARLPDGATPAFDPRETAGHVWLTPSAALDEMAERRIAMWTPTSTTLQQLVAARGLDDVRHHLSPLARGAEQAEAVDHPAPGIARIRSGAAGGIPGQAVDTFLVGLDRLVVVDPGDPGDEAAATLAGIAAGLGARLAAVLLTAPVPDHAGGAEGLALRFGIPVRAAAGARRVLVSEIEPLAGGDVLDLSDLPIVVHATPGTHPDHLAFDVPDAGAVLVGDLEGPGPSRAIPTPVDDAALSRSLATLDSLGDRIRLAAHR